MDERTINEEETLVSERNKLTHDDKLMALLIYLTSFLTTILGPLIIWLLKKNESEFVDYHGKEYFNFFISYME